jgi:hypothetical protein
MFMRFISSWVVGAISALLCGSVAIGMKAEGRKWVVRIMATMQPTMAGVARFRISVLLVVRVRFN